MSMYMHGSLSKSSATDYEAPLDKEIKRKCPSLTYEAHSDVSPAVVFSSFEATNWTDEIQFVLVFALEAGTCFVILS